MGYAGPDPGLCGACVNVRMVESRRGSRFYMCELSRTDPRFPRYPGLPVLRCRGFRPESSPLPDGEGSDGRALTS